MPIVRQLHQLAASLTVSVVILAGSPQSPQSGDCGEPTGTLQKSFPIPPRWCNGTILLFTIIHNLYNKKYFVTKQPTPHYMVTFTSLNLGTIDIVMS